jgi:hypothetical protein
LIKQTEREWFSDKKHWTKDMHAKEAAGIDPMAIIEVASSKLVNDMNYQTRYGFTPEDQQANRKAEYAMHLGIAAGREGMTPGALEASVSESRARQDLIASLDKWGDQRNPSGLGTGPIYPGAGGDPRINAQTGFNVTQSTKSAEWAKKGWSPQALLSQPGMSIAQASDLVNQITGGAYGARMRPVVPKSAEQGRLFGGQTMRNPYATNALLGSAVPPRPVIKPAAPAPAPVSPIVPPKPASGAFKPPKQVEYAPGKFWRPPPPGMAIE